MVYSKVCLLLYELQDDVILGDEDFGRVLVTWNGKEKDDSPPFAEQQCNPI